MLSSIRIASVGFILLVGLSVFLPSEIKQNFVTYDFLAYWSSTQLLISGQDPYSREKLLLLQSGVGNFSLLPAQMWYCPWVFLIFVPIFQFLTIEDSALIWAMFNIITLSTSVSVLYFTICKKVDHAPEISTRQNDSFLIPVVFMLAFYPVVDAITWNQITPLISAAAFLVITFFLIGRTFWAGVFAIFLSIKLHLFLTLYPILIFEVYKKKDLHFVLGLLCSITITALTTTLLFGPQIFIQWLSTLSAPPSHLFTPTLAGWVRYLSITYFNDFSLKSTFLISTIGNLAASVYLLSVFSQKFVRRELVFASALIFSLCFAPYCNVHDFCLLLPALLVILSSSSLVGRILLILALALILVLRVLVFTTAPTLVWLPWLSAIVFFFWTKKQLEKDADRQAV